MAQKPKKFHVTLVIDSGARKEHIEFSTLVKGASDFSAAFDQARTAYLIKLGLEEKEHKERQARHHSTKTPKHHTQKHTCSTFNEAALIKLGKSRHQRLSGGDTELNVCEQRAVVIS